MNDTPDFILEKQREIIFSKTPEERFMMGIEMCRAARRLVEAGIRHENPAITEDELLYQVFVRYYPELVAETQVAWQAFFLRKKIENSLNFSEIQLFYAQFLEQLPFDQRNSEIVKNYHFLFTVLFKKIKNKEQWEFIKSEIRRLGLKMNDYTQQFYDTLNGRF